MNYKLLSGLGAVALALVIFSGCRSTPGSSNFASVEIRGHGVEEIRHTAAAVFRADGYALRSAEGGQLIFERGGSTLNSLAYGNWGDDVVLRVRAQTIYLTTNTYRLQCQAAMVRYAGDRIMEDEQGLANFRRGPFQKLLDDTAAQLK